MRAAFARRAPRAQLAAPAALQRRCALHLVRWLGHRLWLRLRRLALHEDAGLGVCSAPLLSTSYAPEIDLRSF